MLNWPTQKPNSQIFLPYSSFSVYIHWGFSPTAHVVHTLLNVQHLPSNIHAKVVGMTDGVHINQEYSVLVGNIKIMHTDGLDHCRAKRCEFSLQRMLCALHESHILTSIISIVLYTVVQNWLLILCLLTPSLPGWAACAFLIDSMCCSTNRPPMTYSFLSSKGVTPTLWNFLAIYRHTNTFSYPHIRKVHT